MDPRPYLFISSSQCFLRPLLLMSCAAVFACGELPREKGVADAGEPSLSCQQGITCSGPIAQVCSERGKLIPLDCREAGLKCVGGLGCVSCAPGAHTCDGDASMVCRADGSGFEVAAACNSEPGRHCNRESGVCANLCATAEESASYIGCEYWPVVTANPALLEVFSFAVAISNPQAVAARVTIDQGGDASKVLVGPITVPPDALQIVQLPWNSELRKPVVDSGALGSLLVRGAAYRLTSDVPVTVYQFNALQYSVDGDCEGEPERRVGDDRCFSFTNDASLLLPSHVLTGEYMVTARESQRRYESVFSGSGSVALDENDVPQRDLARGGPGFLSVVAVDEVVSVQLSFVANTAAGSTAGPIRAYGAGANQRFSLRRGDVLQILSADDPSAPSCAGTDSTLELTDGFERRVHFCAPKRAYDLTGTRIHADGRVAVLAGHSCAMVPFDRYACDHLEESMFPMETWGHVFAIATTQQLKAEPNVVRVVAALDATAVSFEPAVHAPVTLNAGDFVEFEVMEDFVVTGGGPLSVGQFIVGQDYEGLATSAREAVGDPAFAMVAPVDQYRKRYDFLVPETYTENWISVVSDVGAQVELNGVVIEGWQPVGTTGKQATRVAVPGGAHHIESSGRFGVTVYGFGSYTSYFYSAGLDFQKIIHVL